MSEYPYSMFEPWTQEEIDAELARVKVSLGGKPVKLARVGNQIRRVEVWLRPIGPRMANGMFVTNRCPTCGHRRDFIQ